MNRQDVIWVTGATSGIGLEMTMQLCQQGHLVIASGRNQDKLNELSTRFPLLKTLAFDITDTASVDGVRAGLEAHTLHLDRVILNAGNCEYFDINNPRWEMLSDIMTVNYLGLINCVKIALPLLNNAQQPHIIGICSQASQAPFPRAEAYGASKAAARYFLESLRIDLKQHNIDVTVVMPGFVDTPLTAKNDFTMPFIMSASVAAEKIINAMFKRKLFYAFPKRLSFMLWVARLFPKQWLNMHSKLIQKESTKE